jgi:hypothetical protein
MFSYVAAAAPSWGLRCYQCGEYVDDVGSITPCNAELTEKHLKMCNPSVGDACVVSIHN